MRYKKLTCQQSQEYIDGLSQHQFQEKTESGPVYEHIQQCVTCREYFERAKTLSENLDQWSVPTPKRNITAGVMAQIAQLERDGKTEHISLWSRLPALFLYRFKVPVGAVAAVFVILAVSLVFNITRLNTYQRSKEKLQAKTDQAARTEIDFARRKTRKSYPVSIGPADKTEMCFFGVIPEGAPAPLVIVLGVHGVVPIEITPQYVKNKFQ